jgi:hypothetical protein
MSPRFSIWSIYGAHVADSTPMANAQKKKTRSERGKLTPRASDVKRQSQYFISSPYVRTRSETTKE